MTKVLVDRPRVINVHGDLLRDGLLLADKVDRREQTQNR
jgi:hypothetical protein